MHHIRHLQWTDTYVFVLRLRGQFERVKDGLVFEDLLQQVLVTVVFAGRRQVDGEDGEPASASHQPVLLLLSLGRLASVGQHRLTVMLVLSDRLLRHYQLQLYIEVDNYGALGMCAPPPGACANLAFAIYIYLQWPVVGW